MSAPSAEVKLNVSPSSLANVISSGQSWVGSRVGDSVVAVGAAVGLAVGASVGMSTVKVMLLVVDVH